MTQDEYYKLLPSGDFVRGFIAVDEVGNPTAAVASTDCLLTSVQDMVSPVQLVAANSERVNLTIRNTASTVLAICPGSAPADMSRSVRNLAQDQEWYAPQGYRGPVQGMWATDANDGAAVIAEYVI